MSTFLLGLLILTHMFVFVGGIFIGTKAGPTAAKDVAAAKADLDQAIATAKAGVKAVETAAARVGAVVHPPAAPVVVVAPAPAPVAPAPLA